MTYTEAMFMMFTACFFYFCGRKKFLPASIAAFLAAFTRIAGVFLVFSLLLFMYEADYGWKFSWKNIVDFIKNILLQPLRLFEILICPLGIFGYFYYLYRLTGDVWASAHIQVAWHNLRRYPADIVLQPDQLRKRNIAAVLGSVCDIRNRIVRLSVLSQAVYGSHLWLSGGRHLTQDGRHRDRALYHGEFRHVYRAV